MSSDFMKQSRQEMRRLGIENQQQYDEYLSRKVVTKDSGKRQEFETGARRDTQDGKPRFDQIPLRVLDDMQYTYGGSPLKIDDTQIPFTGFVPGSETRPDLIPTIAINRLAGLYHRGALKYSDNNWQKGIPLSRVYASLFRHLILWFAGDTSEDHLAAVIWNAVTLMWTEWAIDNGTLPKDLADAGALKKKFKK